MLGVMPRASVIPTSSGHAGGAQSLNATQNAALPTFLHPTDLPRIHQAVADGLKSAISSLATSSSPEAGFASNQLHGDSALDALICAHASKAVRVTDFVPMLLPYVVSEATFHTSIRPQSWLSEGVEKACASLVKSKSPVQDVATLSPDGGRAIPNSGTCSSAASLLQMYAPALLSAADAWSDLPVSSFGPAAVSALKAAVAESGQDVRAAMMAARIAVIGVEGGPPLSETLALLGSARAAGRLRSALSSLRH